MDVNAPLSQGDRIIIVSVTLSSTGTGLSIARTTATDLCIRTDDPILDLVKAMYRYF